MGVTTFESLNARNARARVVSSLPTAPYQYYDVASNDVESTEWRGGELAFRLITTYSGRLYIQVNTSGTTAAWVRLLETMATSTSTSTTSTTSTTSSSSTSTTTSTSTSTSTSSSSSSTTSTSSSTSTTTSTSTSSSSTTTGAA